MQIVYWPSPADFLILAQAGGSWYSSAGFWILLAVIILVISVTSIIAAREKQKKVEGQLDRLRTDNRSLSESNKTLQDDNDKLRNKIPKHVVHTVLMDGISGAGKSSFIARLVSPILTSNDLGNITATVSEYQSLAIPICWERNDKTTLHSLRFFDIAGENSGTFVDALYALNNQNSNNNTDVILVIIWDISSKKKWAENINHFNRQRVKATYGSKMASNIIRSIVVFFNKVDLVPSDQVQESVSRAKEAIDNEFRDIFEQGYGEIKYVSGSVMTGQYIHDCLGVILKEFGLATNFHKITGNSTQSY